MCEITGSSELTECPEHSINSRKCSQSHNQHAKSGEGYEHFISSEECEVNPLDARSKDNTCRSEECFEHSIHSKKANQTQIAMNRDGTDQSEGEGREIKGSGSNVSVQKLNWFTSQLAQFVNANTGNRNLPEWEGNAEASKTNTKVQTEFSFFNGI